MAFSTTSYLAGVGSVVVILSTGFAGGYMLANPTHQDPPNRLQRLAAEGQDSKGAAQAAPAAKPEVVAMAAPAATPVPAVPQPAAAEPAPAPAEATAPEPARSTAPQVSAEKASAEKSIAEKARMAEAAEAKAAERKRADARKFAQRRRKQRELEVVTVAVRRMMRDRDDQEFAAMDQPEPPPPEMPRLGLFGQ